MCYGSTEKEWRNLGRVVVRDTGATSSVSKPTGWRHIGTFFFIRHSIISAGLTPGHRELTLYQVITS